MALELRSRLLGRRHSALLTAIVAALAVRPMIGDSGIAVAMFSIALMVLLLVALYTIQVDELVGERETLLLQRRRRSIVGWALAVPAIGERLYVLLAPSPRLYLVGSMSWLLFFCFVTWAELRSMLKHKEITGETISLAVSVYLLIGVTWGILYIVMFQFQPEAFSFGASPTPISAPSPNEPHLFAVFIYFSLTTLATIGYGDITPLTLQVRYAAVAEGITGQLYLAILVARLVGMHMSRSTSQDIGDHARTP